MKELGAWLSKTGKFSENSRPSSQTNEEFGLVGSMVFG
jgi:hypothetical protein